MILAVRSLLPVRQGRFVRHVLHPVDKRPAVGVRIMELV